MMLLHMLPEASSSVMLSLDIFFLSFFLADVP